MHRLYSIHVRSVQKLQQTNNKNCRLCRHDSYELSVPFQSNSLVWAFTNLVKEPKETLFAQINQTTSYKRCPLLFHIPSVCLDLAFLCCCFFANGRILVRNIQQFWQFASETFFVTFYLINMFAVTMVTKGSANQMLILFDLGLWPSKVTLNDAYITSHVYT